jgi:Concanavalin A-like lectin/glucanases superfamily
MAELWELICHHTYRGIPGVVVDTSPHQASHGRAIGLDNSDFLADGATTGSGSLRFYAPDGRVQVRTEAPEWRQLGGVKAEITLRRQPSLGFIIDSGAFQFHIRGNTLDTPVAWFASFPGQYSEIAASLDPVGPTPYRVPAGQWVTLGFMHNGFNTIELSADGQVVARRTGKYGPIAAPGSGGLSIGNALSTSGLTCNGEIDDLKIWRFNPHYFTDNFFARPMDADTAACWRVFRTALDDALRANPECTRQLLAAVKEAMDGFIRQAMAKGPETWHRVEAFAREYDNNWRAGTIDTPEMIKAFIEFLTWMRLVGIPLETDPAVRAIASSACLNEILAKLKPFDCDAQMINVLRAIADAGTTRGAAATA